MHEYNVCQSVVDTVIAQASRMTPPARRVVSASIVVGGLRQLVPEYLQFAYGELTKDTIADGSTLEVKTAPAAGTCEECGWSGEFTDSGFVCGQCSSRKAELTGGRELYLESLEVEQEED